MPGAATQAKADDIATVIKSLFFKGLLVKIALYVPAAILFNCHWYTGVAPPFTGTAVRVISVPVHTVNPAALMLTGAAAVAVVKANMPSVAMPQGVVTFTSPEAPAPAIA